MARTLTSMFTLYTLTPGRRIYTLQEIRKLAKAKQLLEIIEAGDLAIAQDRKAIDLTAEWRDPNVPTGVKAKDQVVDQTLMMIEQMLSYQAAKGRDTAVSLQTKLFPGGANYHTRLPHIEQVTANERVLEILEGKEHGEWLQAHGFGPLTKDLRTAHDEFETLLRARNNHTKVTWEQVKQARATGQELYLKVVVRILAHYLDDPEMRDALMAPIWWQEDQVRAFRRQRRGPLAEVNPETGEILPEQDGGDDAPSNDDAGQAEG